MDTQILTIILMAAGFLFLIAAWSIKRHKPNPPSEPGFDRMEIHTKKSRNLALESIRGQLEIKLVSGREIQVNSLSGVNTRLIKTNLGVQITNPSEYAVTIEEMRWELWLGPTVKTFVTHPKLRLKARNQTANFEIQETMNEQDFVKLVKSEKSENPLGFLEGAAICTTDFGKFEKKFVGFDIPFKIKGNIGHVVDHAQPETPSNIDSLTGLLQRRFIEEDLQVLIETVAGRQPVSLIMFDVDHFKTFNDTYGHLIGDEILKMVSHKIREAMGEKGLGVRYGGDEFCIILEGVDSDGAEKIAHDLHRKVGDVRMKIPQGELKVTLSVGVAVLRHPAHYQELIRMADKALYESKRKGRNAVTVDHTGVP